MSQKNYDSVVIACFATEKERSVHYRKYALAETASKKILDIIEAGKVDYISVRVIGRQKFIPLDQFVSNKRIPVENMAIELTEEHINIAAQKTI